MSADPAPGEWECGAYGPGGLAIGALCHIAARYERICGSPLICHVVMTGERERVFALIQEKAAAGDPDFILLAAHFTAPEMLLGGALSADLSDG